MKIPRLTVVTLGVGDLKKATSFYESVLGTPPNTSYEGVTFIELPGTWLSLFPFENLTRDISPEISFTRGQFGGITLAYNCHSKDEVVAIMKNAKSFGAHIMKEPQETFWGGYSGYFADLDGYHWEIVWGPMFEFSDDGALKFKKGA